MMNSKKNQGGAGYHNNGANGYSASAGYGSHSNGSSGGSNYSGAVQNPKQYSNGAGLATSTSTSSIGGSRPNRGGGHSYNNSNSGPGTINSQQQQQQHLPYYGGAGGGNNGAGNYAPSQGGYNDRKSSYASSTSSSSIGGGGGGGHSASTFHGSQPTNAASTVGHYHGNGHHGPSSSHYQQQLTTSQSFHASNGGGGGGPHMSVLAKYAPQQSYDIKTNAAPVSAAATGATTSNSHQQQHQHQNHHQQHQHHHHRENNNKAPPLPHTDPKQLPVAPTSQAPVPSATTADATQSSRILPSPSNTSAVNRTYSSDSSSSSLAAVVVSSIQKSELDRQPSATAKTLEVTEPTPPTSSAVAAPTPAAAVTPSPTTLTTTTSNGSAKTDEPKASTTTVSGTRPSPPTAVVPAAPELPLSESSNSTTSSTPATPSTPKLADLVKSQQSYDEKSDYCRDLVIAIDRLYPDVKWPLQDTWTFWFIKHDNSQNWLDNVKEIADASYVEDFWSVFRHLGSPSKLSNTTQGDLAFFKKGVKPTWEDMENKTGGSWLHQVPIQQQFNKKTFEVDDLWKESLLALIGDNFCGRDAYGLPLEESQQTANDHVCDNISGVFVAQRGKQYKLTLWTKNFRDERKTRIIGRIWKHILKLSETVTIMFEAHETKYSKTSNIKIVYKE